MDPKDFFDKDAVRMLAWEQRKQQELLKAAIDDFQCWADANVTEGITPPPALNPWANLSPFDLAWLKDLEVGLGDTEAI
jgi:hypothetical protein